jgi:N-dimethylarginine dimethylaminohydrolase
MKYAQRKAELPYYKSIADNLKLKTIIFPPSHVFEGQAEAKWFFGGKLLLCGHGHRATFQSFKILKELLHNIYGYYGVEPPKVIILPIKDPKFFHLDAAMAEYDNKVIVQKRAFSSSSLAMLRHALGAENVTVLDTDDDFCLNAIITKKHFITHKLTNHELKPFFEHLTGRKVIQIDASEFEKSGGSLRCMVLDIY